MALNPAIEILAFDNFVAREPGLARVIELGEYIALVEDPWTGGRYPYWLDEHERALWQRVSDDPRALTGLMAADRARFASAGMLIDPADRVVANARLSAAADQFARDAYAILPRVIPPLQLAALRSYTHALLEEGYVAGHDKQVPARAVLHNEQLMQYHHRQLTGCFARVTGQLLKPSYGYFASYRRGATLEKHVDREQCNLTLSLLLDYVAAPSDDAVWPLYLELPGDKRIAVEQDPGDGVLFSGCEQPHYRDVLRGECSTSVFLHYVDRAFSGSLE